MPDCITTMSYDVIKILKFNKETKTVTGITSESNVFNSRTGKLAYREMEPDNFLTRIWREQGEDALLKRILLEYESGMFHGTPYANGNHLRAGNAFEQAVMDFQTTKDYEGMEWGAPTRDKERLGEMLLAFYKARGTRAKADKTTPSVLEFPADKSGGYLMRVTRKGYYRAFRKELAKVYTSKRRMEEDISILKRCGIDLSAITLEDAPCMEPMLL